MLIRLLKSMPLLSIGVRKRDAVEDPFERVAVEFKLVSAEAMLKADRARARRRAEILAARAKRAEAEAEAAA